jgi:N-acetylglucosamine kinase-like BadF-type ATPase
MAHKQLILGVDGGGSRTRALLADAAGQVLAAGEAGPSNYQSVGFAAATHALEAAIGAARQGAGLTAETPLEVACFGLAGMGRVTDRARFEAWAAGQRIARRCAFVSDAEVVLAAGTPEGWGVALIGGTGSFCWGRAADGHSGRVGGWGYLLGDEGSGYDLAIQALRLATQTADGRAAAHAILRAVLDHWNLGSPDQLIAHVYHPERTRAEIAGVSLPVLALAGSGDPHAVALLERAAGELARMLAAIIRKLDLHQPPVAMAGGLLGASPRLRTAIVEQCGHALGPLNYVEDPARGALSLGRQLLDRRD